MWSTIALQLCEAAHKVRREAEFFELREAVNLRLPVIGPSGKLCHFERSREISVILIKY